MYGSVGGVAMPQAQRMTGLTAMFLNRAVEPPPAKVSTPERSRDKAMSAGGYAPAEPLTPAHPIRSAPSLL